MTPSTLQESVVHYEHGLIVKEVQRLLVVVDQCLTDSRLLSNNVVDNNSHVVRLELKGAQHCIDVAADAFTILLVSTSCDC